MKEMIKDVAYEIPDKFQRTMSDRLFQYNDISSVDISSGKVSENILRIKDAPGRAVFVNKKDDVLISTVRPNRNANAIIEDKNILQVGSNGFCNLRTSNINPNYLFIFSKTKYFRDYLIRFSKSTMYPAVSNIDVMQFPFFRPQNLQTIDEISNQAILLRQLRLDADALYQQAQQLLESELGLDKVKFKKLVGYTARFSELESSSRLDPEYFDPVASEIVKRISTFDHSQLVTNCFIKNGFPWNSKKFLEDNSGEPVVRIRNVRPSHIDIENLSSIEPRYVRSVCFPKAGKGDVVVGMDGIKYFYASILEGDCYVNQRVAHLVWKTSAKISPEYATFIINSRVGQAQLLRDMTIATTVGHITNRDIAKLLIPYISEEFHGQITKLVRQSIEKQKESKRLLDQAKTRVEQLIKEAVQQ